MAVIGGSKSKPGHPTQNPRDCSSARMGGQEDLTPSALRSQVNSEVRSGQVTQYSFRSVNVSEHFKRKKLVRGRLPDFFVFLPSPGP